MAEAPDPPNPRGTPLPLVSNGAFALLPSLSAMASIGLRLAVDFGGLLAAAIANTRPDSNTDDTPPPARSPLRRDLDQLLENKRVASSIGKSISASDTLLKKAGAVAKGRRKKSAFEKMRRNRKSNEKRRLAKISAPLPAFSIPNGFDPPNNAVDSTVKVGELRGGSYIGGHLGKAGRTWSLDELLEMDFELIHWDGTTPRTICDEKGRIWVVLAGRPTDSPKAHRTWSTTVLGAVSSMTEARVTGNEVNAFDTDGRRGKFTSVAVGLSYGNGHKVPSIINQGDKKGPIVEKLLANADIRRIAGFQNRCFAFYFPKVYQQYHTYLNRIYQKKPDLKPNFPERSIYPACTFNLGPLTATHNHVDMQNVTYGICAITALGNFDPTLGGHFILFNLKLVIEFPPGSTVLIPSSIFEHGNTPIIGNNSSRMSFTQYCAGRLFQWVDNGFRTLKQLQKQKGTPEKSMFNRDREAVKAEAMGLLSTYRTLQADRDEVYKSSTS